MLLSGPLGAQTGDSAAVRDVVLDLIRADNERRIAAVLEHYAPDAILFPPGAPPVAGRAAIRPRYEALFRDFDPEIVPVIDEVVVAGDLAYVRGRNRGRLRGRNGRPDRSLDDVYLMILERAPTGRWRIARLIWHPER